MTTEYSDPATWAPEERARALEHLRTELRAERISYGELAELQALAAYIEPGDTELLEAAGVPEHDDDEATYCDWCGAKTSDGPDGNDLCNACIDGQHRAYESTASPDNPAPGSAWSVS